MKFSAVLASIACLVFLGFVFHVDAGVLEDPAPPSDIPVQNWLDAPERNDFNWKVEVAQPYLTFQQRYVVSVAAAFRANNLFKAGLSAADLHFVTKFAGEDGRWFEGQSYSHFSPPANLAGSDQIRSISSVYAKPGKYRIAVIAYDRLHRKGNVWRGTVRVPVIQGDPLSGSDQNVASIEFLRKPPSITGMSLPLLRDPWDFEKEALTLPVDNDVPVQVDILANLSLSDAIRMRHSEAPEFVYQLHAARVTEISRVLSEMNLKRGCIRLSAVNISRQELLIDRADVREFDWSSIQESIQARARAKIDVRTLAGEKKTPSFLTNYLAKLAADPPACNWPERTSPVRVLIVVSDNFMFPSGTEMVHLPPSGAWTRCYHLEVVPVAGPRWDQIDGLLKPLNPMRLEISTPIGFRKNLARMMRDIVNLSKYQPTP